MNIFITQAADDLLALIGAILQPNHSENLGKFLVSSLVGMTLKQAINIIEPNDQQALDNDLSETQNLKTHLLAYLKNHMKNGKNLVYHQHLLMRFTIRPLIMMMTNRLILRQPLKASVIWWTLNGWWLWSVSNRSCTRCVSLLGIINR